jgi:xanthine dehydrogenase molybdopterin-binding subunit B
MPAVGPPIPHESAPAHATGQAVFIDDIPPACNELYVDAVGSPCAHGRLRKIDLAAARAVPGVAELLTRLALPATPEEILMRLSGPPADSVTGTLYERPAMSKV